MSELLQCTAVSSTKAAAAVAAAAAAAAAAAEAAAALAAADCGQRSNLVFIYYYKSFLHIWIMNEKKQS